MYSPLFAALYQGSMSGKSDLLLVWPCILAHADPRGNVDLHPRVIAALTGLSQDRVDAAIAELEADDPESRTMDPVYAGKRMVRLDETRRWGWFVVNHMLYRKMASLGSVRLKAAERQEQKRARDRTSLSDGRVKTVTEQGTCGCCGRPFQRPFSLYVVRDHDHVTGVTRDFLCQSCNKLVGQAENGKPIPADKHQVLAEYLARHGSSRGVTTASQPSHNQSRKEEEEEEEKESTPLPPEGGLVLEPVEPGVPRKPRRPPPDLAGFEEFWALYPKSAGKQEAIKAWAKLGPEDRQRATAAVPAYAAAMVGKDPSFIKFAQGWLNGRRWEDQVQAPAPAPPPPLTEKQKWEKRKDAEAALWDGIKAKEREETRAEYRATIDSMAPETRERLLTVILPEIDPEFAAELSAKGYR